MQSINELLIKLKITKLFKNENFISLMGCISILPFIIISFFNNPNADDFCFYCRSNNLGFLEAQISWYNNWTGRYFSSAILSIKQLITEPFYIYKLIPVILIASLIYSLYRLISLLFINLKMRDIFVIVSLIVFLYFFQMPSISQGIFWLAGSITYQLPNIFSIFLIYSLIKLLETNKTKHLVQTIIFSFFIIGSNEVSMLLIVYIISFVFLYNLILHRKINYSLLTLVLFVFVFSIFVLKSPGNIIRSSSFPNKNNLFYSLFKSSIGLKSYLGIWLPLIITLILIYFEYFRKKTAINSFFIFNVNPVFVLFVVLGIPVLGFFTGYWSVGRIPPDRTINNVYFFFLIGTIYLTFILFYNFREKNLDFINYSSWVKYLLYLLVFISFVKENNIRTTYLELLNGTAYNYNLELKERIDFIKNKNGSAIIIEDLKYKPLTLYVDDVSTDPNNWINKCYAEYYHLESIIMKDKKQP